MAYLLIDPKGKSYLINDTSNDFHTKYGFIDKKYFNDRFVGKEIKTNKGEIFHIIKPNDYDFFSKLKRGPQVIVSKDLGFIISNSLINKNSVCLDTGTGSGFCSIFLARYAKRVFSIDIKKENLVVASKNAEKMNLNNVSFINGDFTKKLNPNYAKKMKGSINLMVLDLPEPWEAISNVLEFLKVGGFLISYSPSTTQVLKMNNALMNTKKFIVIKNSQMVEIPWKFNGKISRPENMILFHTGFLTLVRRVLD